MKKILTGFVGVASAVILASCGGGGGEGGGGLATFTSSYVSVSPPGDIFTSDVLTGNTCTDGVSAEGTFVNDVASFSFRNTVYSNFNGSTQQVFLDGYRIVYEPIRSFSSPDLPEAIGTITRDTTGTPIPFNATGSAIPITIATDDLKAFLTGVADQPAENPINLCSTMTYQYRLHITFFMSDALGKTDTYKTETVIAFADRVSD